MKTVTIVVLGVLAGIGAVLTVFFMIEILTGPEPATPDQHKRNVASCNSLGGQVVIWGDEFARCYVEGDEVFNWIKPEEPAFEERTA